MFSPINIQNNFSIAGKPAKPSPPTDADIIINSFKPPSPQPINEQPEPVDLEPEMGPQSMVNDSGDDGPGVNSNYGKVLKYSVVEIFASSGNSGLIF